MGAYSSLMGECSLRKHNSTFTGPKGRRGDVFNHGNVFAILIFFCSIFCHNKAGKAKVVVVVFSLGFTKAKKENPDGNCQANLDGRTAAW